MSGISNACGPIGNVYNVTGTYQVTFTLTDALGAVSTSTFSFYFHTYKKCWGLLCTRWLGAGTTVQQPCSLGSPLICLKPLTLSFATFVSGGTPPYTYQWNFGDGTGSPLSGPVHTYSEAGQYTVTLMVTDAVHESGQEQFEITV